VERQLPPQARKSLCPLKINKMNRRKKRPVSPSLTQAAGTLKTKSHSKRLLKKTNLPLSLSGVWQRRNKSDSRNNKSKNKPRRR